MNELFTAVDGNAKPLYINNFGHIKPNGLNFFITTKKV